MLIILILLLSIISLLPSLSSLNTQIQRQSQIPRTHAIDKAIGPQKGRVFVGHTTQLHIGPTLLIGTLQIEIGIGNAIRHANVPRRTLTVQLHLQLLNHLLLRLQKLHRRLLRLRRRRLDGRGFLRRGGELIQNALQKSTFARGVPHVAVAIQFVRSLGKVGVGLQHCFIIGTARRHRGGPITIQGRFPHVLQLLVKQNLERRIEGGFQFAQFGIVRAAATAAAVVGSLDGKVFQGLIANGFGDGTKVVNDLGFVDDLTP
mmetsp:Transcript_16604/g.45586  ORF Transcript_16604/g.45586 Transcript_16604/m.45586 type:complete len:260 (+) Transcript_16604:353-1132(+)